MAKLTRHERKINEIAGAVENKIKTSDFWNSQYWTQAQIKRYFEIKSTEIQSQILGSNQDINDEDLDIEKIWNIEFPSNRGFMWQWWTRICNQTWRIVNSLGIHIIPNSMAKMVPELKNDSQKPTKLSDLPSPPTTNTTQDENKSKSSKNEEVIEQQKKTDDETAYKENTKAKNFPMSMEKEQKYDLSLDELRNEETIETWIELGKKYGKAILYFDKKENKLITGNIISTDGDFVSIRVGEESTIPFALGSDGGSLSFNWDKGIKTKRIKLEDCVLFMGRKNGISDIAWTAPLLPLKIYYRYLIECNASNSISKTIQLTKDFEESKKEILRFRSPTKPTLQQKVDPQTSEAINKFTDKKLGEGVSKELMDLINFIKWFDEDYDNFFGWPSAGHKRQSLSGEFASGSTQWVYEYNNFVKRVERALQEVKIKFGINCVMDSTIQPINTIANLDEGGESKKENFRKGNNNAEKSNPETKEVE